MSGEFAFDTTVADMDPNGRRGQYMFAVTDDFLNVGSFHGAYKRDILDSVSS